MLKRGIVNASDLFSNGGRHGFTQLACREFSDPRHVDQALIWNRIELGQNAHLRLGVARGARLA